MFYFIFLKNLCITSLNPLSSNLDLRQAKHIRFNQRTGVFISNQPTIIRRMDYSNSTIL